MSIRNRFCANCLVDLETLQCTGDSSIYNPGGPSISLCERCYFAEETMIDSEGTNDLPDVLVGYKKNIADMQ